MLCMYWIHFACEGMNVDIILSNSSELPFYQQIKNQIKQAILKGTLQEGDLLPSIRNLADDLQVSVLRLDECTMN